DPVGGPGRRFRRWTNCFLHTALRILPHGTLDMLLTGTYYMASQYVPVSNMPNASHQPTAGQDGNVRVWDTSYHGEGLERRYRRTCAALYWAHQHDMGS